MKMVRRLAAAASISCMASVYSEDVVIQSFDRSGILAFGEVTNAIAYSIQWSPSIAGGWTNFTGSLGAWLDDIPAAGSGVVTAAVPMFYRVLAHVPPPGMTHVPAGTFKMGNATNVFPESEGAADELPQHEVFTDAYYIDKYEVTKALWQSVEWAAVSNGFGYSFDLSALFETTNRPIDEVNWYDAVKWCNARSEAEGLTPVYYTDAGFSNIYKTGHIEPYVNWATNGYRLPTEAEWEKAARGGVPDTRFPWDDYTNKISHAKANYEACCRPYDLSSGPHPDFYHFGARSSPVGYFQANPFGLHDVAGNVWEWCWDWYGSDYYAVSDASNPRGASTGTVRLIRGGAFNHNVPFTRCSARGQFLPYDEDPDTYYTIGFRCVRKP